MAASATGGENACHAVVDEDGLQLCGYSRVGVAPCLHSTRAQPATRACAACCKRPASPCSAVLQSCGLDWALQCDPTQACCLDPADALSADAPAACANHTSSAGVCTFAVECFSK